MEIELFDIFIYGFQAAIFLETAVLFYLRGKSGKGTFYESFKYAGFLFAILTITISATAILYIHYGFTDCTTDKTWRQITRLLGAFEIFALAMLLFKIERRTLFTKGLIASIAFLDAIVYALVVDIGYKDLLSYLVIFIIAVANITIPLLYFHIAKITSGEIRRDSIKIGLGAIFVSLAVLFQRRNIDLFDSELYHSLESQLFIPPMFICLILTILGIIFIQSSLILKRVK